MLLRLTSGAVAAFLMIAMHGAFRHASAQDTPGDRKAVRPDGRPEVVELCRVLEGETRTSPVLSAAISRDGGRMVACSRGGRTWVWDARTGRELRELVDPEPDRMQFASKVAFEDGGRRIVSAGPAVRREVHAAFRGYTYWDGSAVKLWDTDSGRLLRTYLELARLPQDVVISRDGARIACSDLGLDLKVWDATSGRETLWMRGPGVKENETGRTSTGPRCFSDDALRFVTINPYPYVQNQAHETRALLLRDLDAGRARTIGPVPHLGRATISPDGRKVAALTFPSSRHIELQLYDFETGALTSRARIACETNPHHFAFSPDGSFIVTGTHQGRLNVWDPASGVRILDVTGGRGVVRAMAQLPDRLRVISGGKARMAENTNELVYDPLIVWDVRVRLNP